MKRALIIGIDDYPNSPLSGCVNDAEAVAHFLCENEDGAPNFNVSCLTSDTGAVNADQMRMAITQLFSGDADTALLYFAGHGKLDPNTSTGYLVSQDVSQSVWGMSLSDILALANQAYPNIRSTVIILDCCHSGNIGEIPAIGNPQAAVIGAGVTILSACKRNEFAQEYDGHGLFTGLILEALKGGAADICGNVTPASLYSYVDQTLGPWDQRPVYKANVQSFVTLRKVNPKVSLTTLRSLPCWFSAPEAHFPLDPTFEPDRENIPAEFRALEPNLENTRIFSQLQTCNRHGLVVPVDEEHMYYAAIKSKACMLTPLGKHYWKLAANRQI